MKETGFRFFPRRIFARPWKRHIPSPFLIGGSIAALLSSFYGGALLAPLTGTLNGVLIGSCAAVLLFLGCTALSGTPGSMADKIGWRKPSGKEIGICFIALLIMLAGSAVLTFAWQQILEAFNIPFEKEQSLLKLAREGGGMTYLKLFLLTAVAVPFMEELIFRRALYGLLLNLGAPIAFAGTALIFAAAHGFLLGAPGLFFMGLVFQAVSNMNRNLSCSIISHALLNGTVLCITAVAARSGLV